MSRQSTGKDLQMSSKHIINTQPHSKKRGKIKLYRDTISHHQIAMNSKAWHHSVSKAVDKPTISHIAGGSTKWYEPM